MILRVPLPQRLSDSRLDWVSAALHQILASETPVREVILDWHRTAVISPAGLAILACLDDWFAEHHLHVRSIYLKKLLRRFPLDQWFGADREERLQPPSIHDFESDDQLLLGFASGIHLGFFERFEATFAARIPEDLLFDCKLILQETMQNSVDHSTSERYYLYAGFWHDEFHAGCLDLGVGIPAKLRQKYAPLSELELVEMALKKGVTTRRQRSGGLGLHYVFHFLKRNQGKLTILSDRGHLRRYFRTRRSQRSEMKWPLPGTWCFVRFPL